MFHSTLQYTLLDYMKETPILLHVNVSDQQIQSVDGKKS